MARAACGGVSEFRNEAFPVVQEYFMRKRLADLGYRWSGHELPISKARDFNLIADEIDCYRESLLKKSKARRGNG